MGGVAPVNGSKVRWARLAVVALTFLAAVGYGVLVPLGEAPDEPGHYNYARILASEGRLPTSEEEHEAFQPPLYYALAAPLVGLGDVTRLPLLANSDFTLEADGPSFLLVHTAEERFPYAGWAAGWHLMRLLSAVLGAVTAYSLFQVGLLISGGSVSAALLGAGALVLMPQFSLVHGAATNDSLALALGSLLVAQVVLAALAPRPRRRLVALGLLWGLAALAKVSMLAAGPGIALALWTGHRRTPLATRARASALDVLAVGLGLAVACGWWFARSMLLYGDPLAWELVAATNAVREGAVTWLADLYGLHRSYWLGYVGMRLPTWFHVITAILSAGAWLGLGVALRRSREDLTPDRRGTLRLLAPVLLLYAAAFLVSWVRWALAVMGTDQARLLYPAAAAVVPLLAAGVVSLVPVPRRRWLGPAGVAVLCLVNLYGLTAGVLPVFRASPQVSPEAVPGAHASVTFGGKLELLAWEVPAEVTAGEDAALRLWWRANAPLGAETWLTVRLVDAQGSVIAWRQGTPDGGPYTPDCWTPGAVIAGRRTLPVPTEAPPGRYRVEVGVQPLGGGDWWPAEADGERSDVWALAELEVRAPQ
jgi:hypothetical protein